jgi:hypothetical protein
MIKKIFIFFIILCLNSFVLSTKVYSKNGPEPEEVYVFDSFPADILNNGKYYVGILLSEEEYESYTLLKIKYNALKENNEILSHYANSFDLLNEEQKKNNLQLIKDLKDIREESMKRTFWEEYGFHIGLGAGILSTIAIIFAAKQI